MHINIVHSSKPCELYKNIASDYLHIRRMSEDLKQMNIDVSLPKITSRRLRTRVILYLGERCNNKKNDKFYFFPLMLNLVTKCLPNINF